MAILSTSSSIIFITRECFVTTRARAQSGLSITPKTKASKIDQLKVMIEAWGMDPNKILSQALVQPHRTVIDAEQHSNKILNQSLKHAILQELRNDNS